VPDLVPSFRLSNRACQSLTWMSVQVTKLPSWILPVVMQALTHLPSSTHYSLLATSKDNQCETSCFIMSAYYSIETGLRHRHANVMTAYPLDNGQIKIFDHAFPDDQNEVRCTILQHSAINSRLHMNVLRALACLLTSASQLEMDANMLASLIPAS
jgi:hypothetical protein